MADSTLRGQILRLACEDEGLRPELLRILKEAGGLTPEEQAYLRKANTVVIQQPPIVVQQGDPGQTVTTMPTAPAAAPSMITSPVVQQQPAPALTPNQSPVGVSAPPATPGAGEVSSLFVPERTQRGFNTELLPELEKLHAQGVPKLEAAQELLKVLHTAFARKDMLYNILIQYQSSFENDGDFLGNLERLIESWATANNGG